MTLKLCVFIIIEILCPVDKNGHNSHFQWKTVVHTFFFFLFRDCEVVLTDWVACKLTYSTMTMTTTTTLQNRYRNVSVASKEAGSSSADHVVKGFCASAYMQCIWPLTNGKARYEPKFSRNRTRSQWEKVRKRKEKCVRSWLLQPMKWKSPIHLVATHA